jgi:hypothetical protein
VWRRTVRARATRGALTEENSPLRESVVEGTTHVYVIHRVLHPQVHDNGFKKKKKATRGIGGSASKGLCTATSTSESGVASLDSSSKPQPVFFPVPVVV